MTFRFGNLLYARAAKKWKNAPFWLFALLVSLIALDFAIS